MIPRSTLRAVILDADGTMFDTLPSLSAAAADVLREAGLLGVPAALLRSALNRGLRQFIRRALVLQPAPVDADEWLRIEQRFLEHYADHRLIDATPYPGLHDALSTLKAHGVRLGVCTNRDRTSTQRLLDLASVASLIDVVIGLGDAPAPKPAAEPLWFAIERLGVSAQEALLVGDSETDCACACSAGVAFAAHIGGYAARPEALIPNVMTFERLDRLVDWVLAQRGEARDPTGA
jgi:phosphoglycolate phosphatase